MEDLDDLADGPRARRPRAPGAAAGRPRRSLFPGAKRVARAQNGERGARAELVLRTQDVAFAHALALVRDPQSARRAARVALVELCGRLGELHDAAELPGFLRRLVESACARSARAPQRGGATDGGEASGEGDARELLAPIHALARAEEREAVLLVHLAGCTAEDAALFLCVPPSAVQSRLAVARRRLHKSVMRRLERELPGLRPSGDGAFAAGVRAAAGLD